jgi:hypothetical protein
MPSACRLPGVAKPIHRASSPVTTWTMSWTRSVAKIAPPGGSPMNGLSTNPISPVITPSAPAVEM